MSEQDLEEVKDRLEEQQNQNVEMYEEPGVTDQSQIEISDGNELEMAKRKILIQRIFHCKDKHTVEQKLNYVIVNSEEEITKLVYGGLFRNKYYKYCPADYCKKHAPNLFEHEDETLVRLGDKFESLECFRLYIDANAKAWKYYLKCADSHRKNGKDTFVFQCVFAKQRKKMSSAKGLRKRTFALPRCECPCRVILKPVPFGADDLTVIYVCNHHDHPLTEDYFSKLQHGRRIHPSIKEELMDLLSLEVDREIVRKYFESLTGYSMNYAFFNNMIINMKKNKVERQFSYEKLKEMYKKIEKIKEEMGIYDDCEENEDNDLITEDNINKDQASQVVEVINVLKSVASKIRHNSGKRRSKQELGESPSRKRQSKQQNITEDEPSPKPQTVNNKSRLETRLQELKHDRETLQSIKHLQDSVRCEAEKNPWVTDHVPEPNSISVGHKAKRIKNTNSQKPTSNDIPEIVPQAIIIETPQTDDAFVQNEEIIYDHDITVVETTGEEIPDSVANVVQVVDLNEINIDDNVSYCIQYDDGQQGDNQVEQQFVLMYDESANIEHIPEVQIQATEFATVSITSDNNKINTEVQNDENCASNVPEDSVNKNIDVLATTDIQVVNEAGCDESEIIEENVYEVIQTNDKKVLPSKDIVDTVILNKRPKPERRSNDCGRYETTSIPKDLKCYKSGKKSLKHNRISRKTKLGRTQDNDVITQYFKEKTVEYINSVFKKDLDKLDDDECYMIVVGDEKEQNCQDESYEEWVESLIGEVESNNSKYNKQPIFEYEDSVKSHDSVNTENVCAPDELESSNDSFDGNLVNNLIESEKCYSSKRLQRVTEKIKLEKVVKRLKRQKHALEQDIKKLVAKKELIKDINRATRKSKRRFYR